MPWAFKTHLSPIELIKAFYFSILDCLIPCNSSSFHAELDEAWEKCWIKESRFEIIHQIPVAATIILNLFFLINIVRVVVGKLRRGPANDGSGSGASRSSLQALRATLLLVPLLGLNFLLTPFRPENGVAWEHFYDLLSAITTSFQGLCVAILFCFCNGEVQAQIKRKWNVAMFRPRANSCTVTTVSDSKHHPGNYVRSSYHPNGKEKV
ncbi:hypothetical protein NQ317_008131 [Molorchus minor]|uniref:G-protein coupled receptors family 2 profile 2 domain-containing protein n=1 Tax=Molorchus minor TaxID=1323400 RepID=A0ABQ9IY48_9CUCU|nr:hypothetical protein NQ317_008131 [Molorchus minor]